MLNDRAIGVVSMTSKPQRLFVVEDEFDIAELVRYNLALEGFHVQTFPTAEEALRACEVNAPDLALLDLMLPGMSGLELCKALKANRKTATIPIVMMTAKGEESDVVKGLEVGADDYIVKPFSPKVVTARIRAVLRRSQITKQFSANQVVESEGLNIHPGRHEVRVNGQVIDLTHSEFQILHFLAQRPGWVFTRSQIVDAIRGDNYAVTDRSIDFQMVGLRKKLGPMGDLLETVRGVGYRFKENQSTEEQQQPTL